MSDGLRLALVFGIMFSIVAGVTGNERFMLVIAIVLAAAGLVIETIATQAAHRRARRQQLCSATGTPGPPAMAGAPG
jgi:MFS-type transporter involved in bile tolerance (Atg22 family)